MVWNPSPTGVTLGIMVTRPKRSKDPDTLTKPVRCAVGRQYPHRPTLEGKRLAAIAAALDAVALDSGLRAMLGSSCQEDDRGTRVSRLPWRVFQQQSRFLISIACILFLQIPTAADTIVLRNGKRLHGVVLSYRHRVALMRVGKERVRIPAAEIRTILYAKRAPEVRKPTGKSRRAVDTARTLLFEPPFAPLLPPALGPLPPLSRNGLRPSEKRPAVAHAFPKNCSPFWRSLAWPGAGHLCIGQRTLGYSLVGAFFITGVGTLLAARRYNRDTRLYSRIAEESFLVAAGTTTVSASDRTLPLGVALLSTRARRLARNRSAASGRMWLGFAGAVYLGGVGHLFWTGRFEEAPHSALAPRVGFGMRWSF